ncbi:hypothetical protein BKE30_15430 [Alkanindiges hydrocarboniclasticus]|uniref:Uncharacterized protein n=1 Tax=Alkanindiges hydrocarboniclasticus TaxID=1907941 RepID=A0A1S8CPZ0_9GAMM|nr:hypothetical protein [Alkanindiges hydrocarboniclasticus]ONG37032.1 hypothetical protein BKE30_15430 [Alkanindiges hydrocarboniclasticus]
MKYTKLSNGMLTDALIPYELKHYKPADEHGIGGRHPFKPDEKISLTFSELEELVTKAREVGNKENEGTLTREYLNSLGLFPVIKNECLLENIQNHKEEHVQSWMSL